MPTNNDNEKITLCISLNARTDSDILAWCNAQSNISASFRSIIRQSIRHAEIMAELKALRSAIDNIKIEAHPESKSTKRKAKVSAEVLHNLDAL